MQLFYPILLEQRSNPRELSLLSLVQGRLIHKESNRIEKTSELLRKINIQHESTSDGMLIQPSPILVKKMSPFTYDTDHDHRLAFAAALVQSQKIPITIQHPEVVSKSFPEFWEIIK